MDFLLNYGLFLAKVVTVLAGVVFLLFSIKAASRLEKAGELKIVDLGEKYQDTVKQLEQYVFDEPSLKKKEKERKKSQKEQEKAQKLAAKANNSDTIDPARLPHLFVLDFKGSVDAKEVNSLREEISAILAIATPEDEVLLRLESGGGMVHAYGLASSQLDRLKQAKIPLTIAVDKVAASGGYMMACVADQLVAAPFAIIGSIGVIAQLPNFNKLLKKNDIEFEQITAGEYKRTLTIFGENTDKAREKFSDELEEIHALFKQFIQERRPAINIEKVATGEHWLAKQALHLGLIDKLSTSDDLLLAAVKEKKVLSIRHQVPKNMMEKISGTAARSASDALLTWLKRDPRTLL
ncbi:MAG: protease SohB [Vibrionaceae bacterium]